MPQRWESDQKKSRRLAVMDLDYLRDTFFHIFSEISWGVPSFSQYIYIYQFFDKCIPTNIHVRYLHIMDMPYFSLSIFPQHAFSTPKKKKTPATLLPMILYLRTAS